MEQSQNLMQNLALFSSLSGLSFERLTQDDTKPCSACIIGAFAESSATPKAIITLCENGFCRLALICHKTIYLSSPVSFSTSSSCKNMVPCRKSAESAPVQHLSPAAFYKAAKLFSFTFAAEEISPLAAELSAELSRLLSSPAETQTAIRNALSKILTQNGNDFFKNKQDLICFILSLYELAESFGGAIWKDEQLSSLYSASSIGHLASCIFEAGKQFTDAVYPTQSRKHVELIQNACLFIAQNYQKRLTQNQVAHAVYVSPPYFSKIFKEAQGCSFNQYLNHLRIAKAKELLASPLIRIEDIATMVGYESRSYFGKTFRRLTGKTPKEYRDCLLPK